MLTVDIFPVSTRKKVILTCCGVLAAVVAAAAYTIQKSSREHGWWHDCRDNCRLIDDTKRLCAEQHHLPAGTAVTWQDIQPYFTNSPYWGWQHPLPSGIPKCPAGGTYTLGNIGAWSMCSTPYHQWPNCKSKDSGSAWRE